MKQRSRHAQLARLLGAAGTLQPYVARIDATHPAPGWYAELAGSAAKHLNGHCWRASDGTVFLGHDTPAAAVTIARVTADA